nr:ergothioneine biosynthesis protein EgtB [Brevundimonas sp.]
MTIRATTSAAWDRDVMRNATQPLTGADHQDSLIARYRAVRQRMLDLVEGLSAEDLSAQSMEDASPGKWHLAHTSWFFEAMILSREDGYQPFDPRFQRLFNSYYEALGERVDRYRRGLMTRPDLDDVLAYRRTIDQRMTDRLMHPLSEEETYLLELGLNHEQQHQELLVQDLTHLFSLNPLAPAAWSHEPRTAPLQPPKGGRVSFEEGLVTIGSDPVDGFAFDNEMPRHRQWLNGYRLARDLVTQGDWLRFMADDGYARAEFWLADGWAKVQAEGWRAPAYWHQTKDGRWEVFGPTGVQAVDPSRPVRNISFYEADAYARWAGARLPTEAEWEHAATSRLDAFSNPDTEVWQWTASDYAPYPGFRPTEGTASEYNGKFMANQMVLRGGSFATPRDHVRRGYRNFYYPHQRWAPTGLRLAYDMTQDDNETNRAFKADLIAGLSASPKAVPPKWFYDEAGSRLFEDITRLEAYYPTRQEAALLREIMPKWVEAFGPDAVLVEFGSGASEKTRIVLDEAAKNLATYVPLDISETALYEAADAIRADYPDLKVVPVVADFENLPELPEGLGQGRRIGFFPGSTIGNLDRVQAEALMSRARQMLGPDSYFILGTDLIKEEQTLVRAYDDPEGVTARFNKNLLVRANRDLGANFDVDAFSHRAVWNADEARVEMHLVATRPMQVTIDSVVFRFAAGETIHTESSRKFDKERVQALAASSGWMVKAFAAGPAPSVALSLLA